MIDVCFSASVEGNLNVIMRQLGNPINSSDIILLDLQLSCGLLGGDLFKTQARREVGIYKSFFANTNKIQSFSLCRQKLRTLKSALSKLSKQLKQSAGIRLWISNTAADLCALYWFCRHASQYDCKIYTVMCPGSEWIENESKFIVNLQWGAFSNLPYMASFAETATELSIGQRNLFSHLWQELVNINSPLRVLVDNKIVSTSEDYFDNAILEHISSDAKPQIDVISSFLEKQYGVDYCFASDRIEHLLAKGKIEIADERTNNAGSHVGRTLKLK